MARLKRALLALGLGFHKKCCTGALQCSCPQTCCTAACMLRFGSLRPCDRPVAAVQVGAALSMVYCSGCPVMFVGVGQTYPDLTRLNIKQVVRSLLK